MISARPNARNYPKILRFLLPLAIIFLFIYLSATKLHVRAYECVEDGKPCEEVPTAARAGSHVTESPPLQVEAVLDERSCGENDFRIGRMLRSFRSCVTRDGQVLLEEYLNGWRELIKFMDALGTVFTFISSETRTKINILQGYLDGEHGQSYRTISSMIRYELDNEVVNFKELPRNRVPSGCRTLLRMHRALKWLEDFLYKVGTSPGQEKTSELCAESYHKTLAHHHSWFIRQVAEVAFLALPPLEKMYEVVCVKDQAEARVVLLTTVDAIVKVYNITQELYTDNEMLDLP
ncbi:glycolipid transfer protein domain-containing protein 2 isoform X2 [Spea bombifrons]|uniref:glycolipid transfer protein domain-containing protein 2 isoform X2 n=1 Tax=Spea bombifrons TaxID=233779 RepID=UPI00234BB676|nr:glycolipid transfer protein domain-containing protein 2 isoform X2 [Spea bombifrons]